MSRRVPRMPKVKHMCSLGECICFDNGMCLVGKKKCNGGEYILTSEANKLRCPFKSLKDGSCIKEIAVRKLERQKVARRLERWASNLKKSIGYVSDYTDGVDDAIDGLLAELKKIGGG